MWIRISQPSGDCTTTCQQPCSTRNPLFISNSFWPTQSPPGLGGRRVVTKPLNGTEAGSGRSASQWRGIRHSPPPATKIPEEPTFWAWGLRVVALAWAAVVAAAAVSCPVVAACRCFGHFRGCCTSFSCGISFAHCLEGHRFTLFVQPAVVDDARIP